MAAPAAADEPRYPSITLDISTIEVQGDATVASDDPTAEINDLFTKTEPAIRIALSPEWSVNALFVLQSIRDPGPDDDRVLEDHGLFVEELHVDYETDRLAVSVGKLTPNFGKAWDTAPGVYGTDFAEGRSFPSASASLPPSPSAMTRSAVTRWGPASFSSTPPSTTA